MTSSPRKNPLDTFSPVKIYPVQLPLTSPHIKLSHQRESEINKNNFIREFWQNHPVNNIARKIHPLETSLLIENYPRVAPCLQFVARTV